MSTNQNMSHSYLVLGGKSSSREEKIKDLYGQHKPGKIFESDPDIHRLINESSIKIEDIRSLERLLSLKPYQAPPKIAIIPEAEKITFEAQNALLKILEEPPGETIFFLATAEESCLLPTIISRCQKIFLKIEMGFTLDEKELNEAKRFTQEILMAQPGKRLKLVEKITTREEAVALCQKQLAFWHDVLRKKPTTGRAKVLRQIQKTLKYLSANVNPKLAVENMLLSYPGK